MEAPPAQLPTPKQPAAIVTDAEKRKERHDRHLSVSILVPEGDNKNIKIEGKPSQEVAAEPAPAEPPVEKIKVMTLPTYGVFLLQHSSLS